MAKKNVRASLIVYARLPDVEFREFRNEMNSWKQHTGERVKSLEVMVNDGLQDNGTPSRMTAVESRLSLLETVRWRVGGAFVALWGLITLASSFAAKFIPWSSLIHGGK